MISGIEYVVSEDMLAMEVYSYNFSLFYCYAHQDESYGSALKTHLINLERQGVITGWSALEILAGTEWAKEIDIHLNTAHLILPLISPDFLASDYCYDVEMKRALERHKAGEAHVIPVIIRPSDWKGTQFSKLEVLPTKAKAVSRWSDHDEAWLDVIQGIRRVVNELHASLTSKVNKLKAHGKELADQGQYEAALADFNHALALNNQDAEVFASRGMIYAQMKRYEDASSDFSRARTLSEQKPYEQPIKVEHDYQIQILKPLDLKKRPIRRELLNGRQPEIKTSDKAEVSLEKEKVEQDLLSVAWRLLPAGVELIEHHYQEKQFTLHIVCKPGITQEENIRIKAAFKKETGGYTLGPSPILKQPYSESRIYKLLEVAQRLLPMGVELVDFKYQENQSTLHITCKPGVTLEEKARIKAEFGKRAHGYALGLTPILKQPSSEGEEQSEQVLQRLLDVVWGLFPKNVQLKNPRLQEEQRTLHVTCIPGISKAELRQKRKDFRKSTGYTLGVACTLN
jgi:tetratricopeptide (TPR) repeat protein